MQVSEKTHTYLAHQVWVPNVVEEEEKRGPCPKLHDGLEEIGQKTGMVSWCYGVMVTEVLGRDVKCTQLAQAGAKKLKLGWLGSETKSKSKLGLAQAEKKLEFLS